jgi:hypothetical protein
MEILRNILLFLHVLGAAAIVGIWFATFRKPTVLPGQFHAALLQLVTGLALVGIIEAGDLANVNNVKIAVKLLIAIAVAVAAFIGYRKHKRGQTVSTGLAHAVGGLALINIAVATLWQ